MQVLADRQLVRHRRHARERVARIAGIGQLQSRDADRGAALRAQHQLPDDLASRARLAEIDGQIRIGREPVVAALARRIDAADLQRAGDAGPVQRDLELRLPLGIRLHRDLAVVLAEARRRVLDGQLDRLASRDRQRETGSEAGSEALVGEALGAKDVVADTVDEDLVRLVKYGRPAGADTLDRGGGYPGLLGERGVRVPFVLGAPEPGGADDRQFRQPVRQRGAPAQMLAQL